MNDGRTAPLPVDAWRRSILFDDVGRIPYLTERGRPYVACDDSDLTACGRRIEREPVSRHLTPKRRREVFDAWHRRTREGCDDGRCLLCGNWLID